MKDGRIPTLLTLVNLGILGFLLSHQTRIVEAKGALPVLRGSGLEIVDAQGKVRASIQLVPEGPAIMADGSVGKGGKIYPETVRFRLIRADGRPSVKIYDLGARLGTDSGRRRRPHLHRIERRWRRSVSRPDEQGRTAANH